MKIIDIKKLFLRLCATEYELIKYINRTQGEAPAPVNFYEAATALGLDKEEVRRALKRLVEAKALKAEGENFCIDEEIFKEQQKST